MYSHLQVSNFVLWKNNLIFLNRKCYILNLTDHLSSWLKLNSLSCIKLDVNLLIVDKRLHSIRQDKWYLNKRSRSLFVPIN